MLLPQVFVFSPGFSCQQRLAVPPGHLLLQIRECLPGVHAVVQELLPDATVQVPAGQVLR